MCGRYTLAKTERLKMMMAEAGFVFDEFSEVRLGARFNVSPGQLIPLGLRRPGPIGTHALWGLRPPFVRDPREAFKMINARAETVATRPAYRAAFQLRRCILPADGFFEFLPIGKAKQPIRFTLPDERPFFFPGLWEDWREPGSPPDAPRVLTCTLITTTPNAVVAPYHDRMPVILPPEHVEAWMDPATSEGALLALLCPYTAPMTATPVSRDVNNSRNEGARLIEPCGPIEEQPPEKVPPATSTQGELLF